MKKILDMFVILLQSAELAVKARMKDTFERFQGFFTGHGVLIKKLVILFFDTFELPVVLDFETELFQNIGETVCFGKSGHWDDDLSGVFSFRDALLRSNTVQSTEVVDPVSNLYI